MKGLSNQFFKRPFSFGLAILVVTSCSNDSPTSGDEAAAVRFEFIHTEYGEVFYAETRDLAVIEMARLELENPIEQRVLHINGQLRRGSAGVNDPWSWHFPPDSWSMAEMSMELCDSWPSYVENNLDDWLEEVGSFCPWSSKVNREVN